MIQNNSSVRTPRTKIDLSFKNMLIIGKKMSISGSQNRFLQKFSKIPSMIMIEKDQSLCSFYTSWNIFWLLELSITRSVFLDFWSWGINPVIKSVEMNKGTISMIRMSLGDQNWRGNITLHTNSKPCVIELEYYNISALNKPSKSIYMLKITVFFLKNPSFWKNIFKFQIFQK